MKKIIYAVILGAIALTCYTVLHLQNGPKTGSVLYNTNPTFVVASSTTFALTTSSQRLLGTSTTPKRLSATIQPVNCTVGSAVYLNTNGDRPATANNGLVAFSSSTLALQDYPLTPVVQGAVQGITGVGTCTVIVTEWRSQY